MAAACGILLKHSWQARSRLLSAGGLSGAAGTVVRAGSGTLAAADRSRGSVAIANLADMVWRLGLELPVARWICERSAENHADTQGAILLTSTQSSASFFAMPLHEMCLNRHLSFSFWHTGPPQGPASCPL
jgi:hypothetical protein